jgi:hypothetical protein
MTSTNIFIYQLFHNYYLTNPNLDIISDNNNIQYYYYIGKNKITYTLPIPYKYISYIIPNTNKKVDIYIEFQNNMDILFIILRQTQYGFAGDHFHIGPGISGINEHRSNKKTGLIVNNNNPIFLHWSLQDDSKGKRNMFTKCTIRDGAEDLNHIDNILCTNRQNMTMKDEFDRTNIGINPRAGTIVPGLSPNQLDLLPIIKHILRRPFYPLQQAGSKKIYIGPRGGKYIKRKNKKIYVK